MGEEKIFKDLTKKYAELAKCIRSKDKRSVSLIKSCSKRIALLDKLRVLEVSYLKCLKSKVKRGQKGGKEGDEDDEEEKKRNGNQEVSNEEDEGKERNENQVVSISNEEDEEDAEDNNRFRAIVACTRAVDTGISTITNIKQTGQIYKEKAAEFVKDMKNLDTEKLKTSMSETAGFLKNKATGFGNNILKRFQTNQQPTQPPTGGKKTTYRLNGEKVVLLHKNKKVQRSIYVKDKGKTKYCKIDKEYVLLSKVKNKIQ